MASAQDRVLSTPELLEHILAQLPTRDLLFAQRLSRHFRKAITLSPSLQQLLFFHASPFKEDRQWTLNPLLREVLVPWFVRPSNRWAMPTYESIELLDGLDDESGRQAFLRPEASWRRMLLIQPPPTSLSVVKFCHAMMGDFCNEAKVPFKGSKSGGVTMGVIYDITESFLRHERVASFGLSILDLEEGPQITLYLTYTVQCCIDTDLRKWSLRSEAAEIQEQHLEYKEREESAERKRFDRTWTSDLTVEKGGVDSVEFERWQRDRAPISSLLSDVR
ncbi:hypothetical protein BU26DRAFT_547233 [Trematosphaeria pertusa]|uniref:F-box domain-containing protein n=1 Tax=Trematosphaeria pertusa TaxID=390896 RepID=A0A6A6IY51_9PLEO|nr:uncharacterized protein BU26DRAFT_547233 [Trematosphaeria pertusa]KAF2255238.1 hypothetical protein BU26DRAFT_547233 [Trematosphaeria pertusa]